MNHLRIGWTHRMLGNRPEARREYDLAETTLRQALEWAKGLRDDTRGGAELNMEFRQRYTENLRQVLRDLISFLKDSGDAEAAAAAQRRLDAVK